MNAHPIIWLSFAASLVPLLLAYLGALRIRRASRARGETPRPSRLVLTAGFYLGAAGGAVFGLLVGPRLPIARWGPLVADGLAGPVAEELGKGLLVLGLVAAGQLRTRGDGVCVGLVAGAGFAGLENLLFTIQSYASAGVEHWQMVLHIRLAFGTLIHLSASVAFAATLVHVGTTWPRRIVAPAIALIPALAIHAGWNTSLTLLPVDRLWAFAAAGVVVFALASLLALYDTSAAMPRPPRPAS